MKRQSGREKVGGFNLDTSKNMKYTDTKKQDNYKSQIVSKNYLHDQLDYVINGEKLFIPKHAEFENIVTIAGAGSETPIRVADSLVSTYGGISTDWQKRAGKITSDKYIFDIHWYELYGVQYDVKLKSRTERKT